MFASQRATAWQASRNRGVNTTMRMRSEMRCAAFEMPARRLGMRSATAPTDLSVCALRVRAQVPWDYWWNVNGCNVSRVESERETDMLQRCR